MRKITKHRERDDCARELIDLVISIAIMIVVTLIMYTGIYYAI